MKLHEIRFSKNGRKLDPNNLSNEDLEAFTIIMEQWLRRFRRHRERAAGKTVQQTILREGMTLTITVPPSVPLATEIVLNGRKYFLNGDVK